MKTKYSSVLLILIVVTIFTSMACLIPKKIEGQASWATIQDSQWKLQWYNSIPTKEKVTTWDSITDVDIMSRAATWYNESKQVGILVLTTPDIMVRGLIPKNPIRTQSDEWVLRELARQGGSVAQEKLDIAFDPATVPLRFHEAAAAQTSLGIGMKGSRFIATTPQGDGYVTILRGVHEKDVIVFITVAESLSASRASDSAALLLRHPSQEPATTVQGATGISNAGLRFLGELEGGFREYAYNDLGDADPRSKCTIGYGQVLFFRPCTLQERQTIRITEEEARKFFEVRPQRDANKILELVAIPLSQHQFDALISFQL